ncbi:MAG: hypothetical protein M3Q74_14605 [Pseudomonadota bacterium]|nr:hypothetical protein [Pseudomonadota bacterium]
MASTAADLFDDFGLFVEKDVQTLGRVFFGDRAGCAGDAAVHNIYGNGDFHFWFPDEPLKLARPAHVSGGVGRS